MRHIPVCIDEEKAKTLFQRESFFSKITARLFSEKTQNSKSPRYECVYFPYYLVEVALRSSKGDSSVLVTVEAWTGAFAFLEQENALRDATPGDGEIFPPRMKPNEAEETAIKELTRHILQQRGLSEKPTPTGVVRSECILYPLWLCYLEAQNGKLTLKVRDAVLGSLVGNRTRNGILQAFIQNTKK